MKFYKVHSILHETSHKNNHQTDFFHVFVYTTQHVAVNARAIKLSVNLCAENIQTFLNKMLSLVLQTNA